MSKYTNTQKSPRRGFWLLLLGAVLVAFVLALSDDAALAEGAAINDPLFSLDFDPRYVHFDLVSTKELLPSCKKALLEIKPLPPALSLYAKYKKPSTTIYIVGAGNVLGIYVLRDGRCSAGIPILALLQRHHSPPEPQDAPVLSDSEVTEVFSDALIRYSNAFGGKARFFEWLDTSTKEARNGCKGPDKVCPPTYRSFTSALQEVLEGYRRSRN